jgi:hypothetical protein
MAIHRDSDLHWAFSILIFINALKEMLLQLYVS